MAFAGIAHEHGALVLAKERGEELLGLLNGNGVESPWTSISGVSTLSARSTALFSRYRSVCSHGRAAHPYPALLELQHPEHLRRVRPGEVAVTCRPFREPVQAHEIRKAGVLAMAVRNRVVSVMIPSVAKPPSLWPAMAI